MNIGTRAIRITAEAEQPVKIVNSANSGTLYYADSSEANGLAQ